jgi:hypothetical protein
MLYLIAFNVIQAITAAQLQWQPQMAYAQLVTTAHLVQLQQLRRYVQLAVIALLDLPLQQSA